MPVPEKPSPKVLIYADGSCLKNGSEHAQAGAGVVLLTEDRWRIKLKACYLGALTNQKAEILACAVALESLKWACRVRIFSDSKYVVETMLGKNRMKTNREYWNRLVEACLTHQIEWNWIRGHNGNSYQETADRLSRAAATAKENLDKNTLDRLADLMQGAPGADVVKMIHDGIKTLAAAGRSERERLTVRALINSTANSVIASPINRRSPRRKPSSQEKCSPNTGRKTPLAFNDISAGRQPVERLESFSEIVCCRKEF